MEINKRVFLKLSGLALLGAGALPAGRGRTASTAMYPSPQATPGRRWAMVIIPGNCRDGCRDCINACHLTHNVPDFATNPNPRLNNLKHELKWIWTDTYGHVFDVPESELAYVEEKLHHLPLPVLCNHCDNPPCVRVCPTKATFKRPDGIVMMDFHRCIGCRFCMAACPYGSRSFNFRDPRQAFLEEGPDGKDRVKLPNPDFPTRMKGVVEKCNFCAERLAVGRLPACVEACPNRALVFGDLSDQGSEVAVLLKEHLATKRKPELGTVPMVYYLL